MVESIHNKRVNQQKLKLFFFGKRPLLFPASSWASSRSSWPIDPGRAINQPSPNDEESGRRCRNSSDCVVFFFFVYSSLSFRFSYCFFFHKTRLKVKARESGLTKKTALRISSFCCCCFCCCCCCCCFYEPPPVPQIHFESPGSADLACRSFYQRKCACFFLVLVFISQHKDD